MAEARAALGDLEGAVASQHDAEQRPPDPGRQDERLRPGASAASTTTSAGWLSRAHAAISCTVPTSSHKA
jgi:hypothetical protein